MLFYSCQGQELTKSEISSSTTSSREESDFLQQKVPIPKNGFYCGFKDSQGILWFGSRGGGAYRYDGNSFTHFTQQDGLCSNDISCITEDREGNLWFGTPVGLCQFDRTTFSKIDIPQSDTSSLWLDQVYPVINPNQVMSILQDQNNHLWIGTNGAGVYRYDGHSFTQFLSEIGIIYEDGLYHNIVLNIIEDQAGNIWFTSLSHGGISKYDGESFTQYLEKDGLSDDFVRTIFCDQSGNIWVGTHGNHNGGLDRFDGAEFTNFHKTDDGLSHNNVRWIFEDSKGQLWLGSGTSYLSIFDGQNFKVFVDNNGQKYNKILFTIGDDDHNIWFGSPNGLWKYDGTDVFNMIK